MKLFSIVLGALLALALLLCAVYVPAVNEALFEKALFKHVSPDSVFVSADSLRAYASNTLRYIKGKDAQWQPERFGLPDAPEAFRLHMEQVRAVVIKAPWILLPIIIGVLALAIGGILRRRETLMGMGIVGAAVAILLAWAALDFRSFWKTLHYLFIRDGIFSAREPIMRLFPMSLFFEYLPYVGMAACANAAIAVALVAKCHFGRKA